MSIDTNSAAAIPSDLLADSESVVSDILAGKRPDPRLADRIRERAAKVTAEVRARHGVLEIGVEAIRELRNS